MGLSADDLRNLEQSESDFSLAVQAATFKQLVFKLKIAEENYNDETRIKMSVVRWVGSSWKHVVYLPLSALHTVTLPSMMQALSRPVVLLSIF